jgi:hypothetical protein
MRPAAQIGRMSAFDAQRHSATAVESPLSGFDLPVACKRTQFKSFGAQWDGEGDAATAAFKVSQCGARSEIRKGSRELHAPAAIGAARPWCIGVHELDGASG